MTTSEIDTLVRAQIQDLYGVRWGTTIIPYLNLAIIEILNINPEANPVPQLLTLSQGPIQSILTGNNGNNALSLLDVVCNMGSDGNTQGNAIICLDKGVMDDLLPDWMTFTSGNDVIYAIYDDRTPTRFYVFPPMAGNNQRVSVVLSERPAALDDANNAFPLDDSYIPAVVDYIIYRALNEETTIPNAIQKANGHLQKFYQGIGLKSNTDSQTEKKGL